ncbi:hypothetical protein [Neisseria gonorrhoeae]|nr:hypothetical protein [Neisseria gonorrhoeae]QOG35452.1 hypothetical protein IBX75_07675 [Neisseria gonorrhoeae]
MPSETVGSIVNVGIDEAVGFSPPFPSIQHFYRAVCNRTVIPTEVGI